MAKGKYQKWLEPENLTLLEGWARNGLTDEQIAHNMGISVRSLYEYKERFPQILQSLKKGKEVVDFEVENALLKKARGHKEKVLKAFKIKKVKYNKDGKRISEIENIEYAEEEVYIPPDTLAQIFWLKNRKKEQWRDKQPEATNTDALNKLDNILEEIREDAKRSTK